MTKRKILSLLLVMLLTLCTLTAVSCGEGDPGKVEWPEAGVYKFTAGETECTLVLSVGDTFTIVYNDGAESGTYTLTDSTLVLDFNAEDKSDITATYSDKTITLSYNGSEMILYKSIEYAVTFVTNGGSAVEKQTVINGEMATEPAAPTREGYEFIGWYADSDFSSAFNFGTPITADTTVYARWKEIPKDTQLPDPEITVTPGQISWNSIAGARSYIVEIIAADGTVVFTQDTAASVINLSFSQFEAAVYTVRVTAIAQTGEEDNSSKEITYEHDALAKVTGISVESPDMLVFDAVENAEKYLITVVCGDPNHSHTNVDLGTNRYYSLENCVMVKEGIKVTITAVADGYATSVSDTFVYLKELAAVSGFSFDEKTQLVSWSKVDNATAYMVSVKCGDASHSTEYVSVDTNSVSLKSCAPRVGGIEISVYPVAHNYISPEATGFVCEKVALQTPADITVDGTLLKWSAVSGAASYEVEIGGKVYTATTNSYDMLPLLNFVEGTEYSVKIRAIASDNSSFWSDEFKTRYYTMGGDPVYGKSTVTWVPVLGAAGYEVQVNDGEIVSLPRGTTSATVELTRAGANTVKVRFVDGNFASEWKSVEVYAHTLTFDSLGGHEVFVQYKATGDAITLPKASKTGYDFVAWYDLPGGASANGKIYNEEFFSGNGSITLYAQYTAKEYEIKYNYGLGGSGTSVNGTVKFENHYTLEIPTSNDPTSVFGGWYSLPYGMGVQYTDSKGNSLAPWSMAEGAELYAFWVDDALKFTLTTVNGKAAYMVSKGDRISLVTEITIPATYEGLNVAMIAGNAFLDCTGLEVINIPATVEQISAVSPFGGCVALREVNVYGVSGVSGRFWSEDGVLYDNGNSATATPKLLFMPTAKTGTYTIPDGITEIPESALAGSQISKIVIPASVTRIGRSAFADCTKLVSVVFSAPAEGESAASLMIGATAFSGCTSLERIVLPERLAEIKLQKYSISDGAVTLDGAENAFAGCTSLTSITVAPGNASYKSVDGVIYSKDGKTLLYCPVTLTPADGKLTVAKGTQSIAPGAFIGCTGITELTLPNTVTLVGECAFYGLTALNRVTFGGNSLVSLTVGRFAFAACSGLIELVMETGSRISVISEGAFMGCNKLASLTIPATVTSIEADAFRDCTELATVTFAANGQTLAFGENVFYNCTALTRVELPANVSAIPGIFNGCTSLTEVVVDADSPYFESDAEGVVFNKGKTEIVFFPAGKTGEYTLPETVTTINNGVFRNVKLDKITIGNAITKIGEDAFRGAEITTVVFAAGENTQPLEICAGAFYNLKGDTIELPAHTKSIGENAFAYSEIYNGVKLNEGLETLGAYAFYNAEISSWSAGPITVPASVKTIGERCFSSEGGWYGYAVDVVLTVENSQLETIGFAAFCDNAEISSITIPASVKTIEAFAFYGAEELSTLEFAEGSSLETIGAYAFSGSSSGYVPRFDSVTIPKSVTSIGAYAFANGKLETLIFEKGGTADLVIGTSYRGLNDSGVEIVATGYAFYNIYYLETVELPARLVEIKASSFEQAGYYVSNMNVTLPEDDGEIRLTTIGPRAFYYSSLGSFVIPTSVRNLEPAIDAATGEYYDRIGIGDYAFYGIYDSLTSVTFELGGTDALTIGKNAFENCDKLTALQLPARLAPYTSHTGEVIAPLANGSLVFTDSEGLTGITVEAGGAYYKDIDGVLFNADTTELIFYPASREGAFEVPATVKKIADKAFYNASKLTAITFAEGSALEEIGESAFYGCSAITEITLPTGVKTLGESVFVRCSSLETLNLSKSLVAFNGAMIERCDAIKLVNVESGNPYLYSDNGVLYNGDKTALIFYPASREGESYTVLGTTLTVEANAFDSNKNLVSIILPEGLVEIGQYAFAGCEKLESIEIPSTVTLLDSWAFSGSSMLASVTFAEGGTGKLVINKYAFQSISASTITIPARVAYIGDYAFYYARLAEINFAENSQLVELGDQVFQNTKLVSVTLPDGIATIGNAVFSGCTSLTSVVFGEGLLTLGDETFSGTSVESVHFPASLRTLGVETFANVATIKKVTFAPYAQLESIPAGTFYNSGIEEFTVPASVKDIADKDTSTSYSYGAFHDATALEKIEFAEGSACANIGHYAFYGCTALVDVTIPASVSTLGEYAFGNCTALESITIPATVTQFGGSTFSTCTALKNVTLNTRASVLPGFMFANCSSLESITIPANVSEIGANCFGGTSISAFKVSSENKFFSTVDGIIYSADKTRILMFPPKSTIATLTIPKEVTEIGEGTFAGLTSLKSVVFEEGRTADLVIGDEAFANCSNLHTVVLPERLTVIGEEAFMYCYALTDITIPSTVTEIKDDAFYGCRKLLEICNKSKLEISLDGYSDFGYIASNAANVYTPTEGGSMFTLDENGFALFTYEGFVYLVGYKGDAVDISLPANANAIYDYAFYNNTDLKTVLIPEGSCDDDSVGSSAFSGCDNLTLLCAAASKPSAWSSSWNSSCPVVWGYTGNNATYTFVTNGAGEIAPIVGNMPVELPELTKDGYHFMGWYTTEDFAGVALSGSYYSGTDVTLYAKFLTEEQYAEEMLKGTTKEYAFDGVSGGYYEANIANGGDKVWIKITVEAGETWNIYTTHVSGDTSDHAIWIDAEDGTALKSKWDGGYTENKDYTFSEAGTYYIGIGCYYNYYTGRAGVTLTKLN